MNTHADNIDWGKGAKDYGVSIATRDFVAPGAGRYILVLNGTGIEFEIDRLHLKFDQLHGQLTVRCQLPGARTIDAAGTLTVADFALSDLRARRERAQLLMKRSQAPTIDWFGLLEEFCNRVLLADRQGDPPVHLRDLERPQPDDDLDVDGFRLLRAHPIITFGDGGTLKSYFALYVAGTLARRGLRVGFFDWEFAGEDHRDRLERLFGAEMPDVLYCRCDRPLVAEVDRLRRIVADERIDYAIFDSVAFATDGPPEAADSAAAYYRAVRSLGVGSLHIAHVNRSETGNTKPFGSVFWANGARMTWFVQKTDEASDSRQVTIGCFCRKSNVGALRPALAFEFSFDAERTSIRRVDAASVEDLAARLPLWQRMAHVLRGGPLTLAAIAERLDAKVDTLERAVRRGKGKLFTRVSDSPDGITRIALVERRST